MKKDSIKVKTGQKEEYNGKALSNCCDLFDLKLNIANGHFSFMLKARREVLSVKSVNFKFGMKIA